MCGCERTGRARGLARLAAVFAVVLVFGCMPYELKNVLDGPQGKPLSVSPSETVVVTGNTVGLTANGGVGPYVYAFVSGAGTGTLSPAGMFSAVSAGTAVIRVTDKTGKSVDATVTVQTGVSANVDYVVSSVAVAPVARVPNGPVNGTFQYTNIGLGTGTPTQTLSWEVYASTNNQIDVNDILVASGSGLPALASSALSPAIPWNGFWPMSFGDYFMLVRVSCAEDSNTANNVGSSPVQANVGVYDETAMGSHGDFTNLTDAAPLGITLRPGMSVKITGSMGVGNQDDIFLFNTGTASHLVVTVAWATVPASNAPNVRIWFGQGPPALWTEEASLRTSSMSADWDLGALNAPRYLDLDNWWNALASDYTGPPVDSLTYTCWVTAQ